jgi:hypothetical protein
VSDGRDDSKFGGEGQEFGGMHGGGGRSCGRASRARTSKRWLGLDDGRRGRYLREREREAEESDRCCTKLA